MTLGQHQQEFSKDFNKLLTYLHQNGYDVRIGEVQRTQEQQALYVKQGKSKTNKSNHLIKCAVDIHIFKNSQHLQTKTELQNIGDYWESLNADNRWGGNFKTFIDTPHFERNAQKYF